MSFTMRIISSGVEGALVTNHSGRPSPTHSRPPSQRQKSWLEKWFPVPEMIYTEKNFFTFSAHIFSLTNKNHFLLPEMIYTEKNFFTFPVQLFHVQARNHFLLQEMISTQKNFLSTFSRFHICFVFWSNFRWNEKNIFCCRKWFILKKMWKSFPFLMWIQKSSCSRKWKWGPKWVFNVTWSDFQLRAPWLRRFLLRGLLPRLLLRLRSNNWHGDGRARNLCDVTGDLVPIVRRRRRRSLWLVVIVIEANGELFVRFPFVRFPFRFRSCSGLRLLVILQTRLRLGFAVLLTINTRTNW